MTIHRLSDRPHMARATADLMTRIWPAHYGPGGGGHALADVFRRITEDRAAIAVQDGKVVGTVALADTSFGDTGEGPWLVGLCTDPTVRARGFGTALASWAMGNARRAGHPALYATTQDAAGIFARLGWTHLRTLTEGSGQWTVWSCDLTGAPVQDDPEDR